MKEDIDLSAYIGQYILIRFTLVTDFSVNKDGFYFDDLLIRKLAAPLPAGIKSNVVISDNIVLSPNPSNGIFNLYNPDLKEMSIEVFNTIGQVVFNSHIANSANSVIDLRNQSTGIYFVKIKFNGQEVVRKIIVE